MTDHTFKAYDGKDTGIAVLARFSKEETKEIFECIKDEPLTDFIRIAVLEKVRSNE